MADPEPTTIRLRRKPAPLSFVLVALVIIISTVNLLVLTRTASNNHKDVQGLLTTIHNHQVAIQSDTTQISNDRAFELILEEEIEVLAVQLTKAGISPHLISLPVPKAAAPKG